MFPNSTMTRSTPGMAGNVSGWKLHLILITAAIPESPIAPSLQ